MSQFAPTRGSSRHVDFGTTGPAAKRCGVCFFGDQNAPGLEHAMQGASAQHPDEAALAPHQKFTFWFDTGSLRGYGELLDLIRRTRELLEAHGWSTAEEVEGSRDPAIEVSGLEESADFPEEPNVEGLNAADHFSVAFENREKAPDFSAEEVGRVVEIFKKAMKMVYDEELVLNPRRLWT